MTREESIAYFKRHLDLYCVDGISREAEEMAIKSLEQKDSTKEELIERIQELETEIVILKNQVRERDIIIGALNFVVKGKGG